MNSGDQFEVEGLMQISAEFVLEQFHNFWTRNEVSSYFLKLDIRCRILQKVWSTKSTLYLGQLKVDRLFGART
ncbi:hypothetical protein QL285_027908 [Trifolium repens]|nr:hypothetical protein QL285_027908 [Trifolium repens]